MLDIRARKIPYYMLLSLLWIGASLIVGLLSFGGMFALWPVLSLAFASFFLSVIYEGQIFIKNFQEALAKLFFKVNYLVNTLAKKVLLTCTMRLKIFSPDDGDIDECPAFFKDYKIALEQLDQFSHADNLDAASLARKKQVEKTLGDMEKSFAELLFSQEDPSTLTPYQAELRAWLDKHTEHTAEHAAEQLKKHQRLFLGVKIFSVIAALFMSFGTSYLLMEVFALIPILAALPVAIVPLLIVPMSLIAGIAYGFLSYNAITDLIANDSFGKLYRELRDDYRTNGFTGKNVIKMFSTGILFTLSVLLTVCTAGTWWTVVKNTKPVFAWMLRIPSFVLGIIHPIITGISTLLFDLQNTRQTLVMLGNFFHGIGHRLKETFQTLRNRLDKENWLQKINLPRIILAVTILPLRIALFFGHLLSIGVTADRMPGLSERVSAFLGMLCELFQDFHYFGHIHAHKHDLKDQLEDRLGAEEGHDHGTDIPTEILKIVFTPLYFLAALWAFASSQFNDDTTLNPDGSKATPKLTFMQAWRQQTGTEEETVTLDPATPQPSDAWKVQQTLYLIGRQEQKLQGVQQSQERDDKIVALGNFKAEVKQKTSITPEEIRKEGEKPVYNQHRHAAFFSPVKTDTREHFEKMEERQFTAAAAG